MNTLAPHHHQSNPVTVVTHALAVFRIHVPRSDRGQLLKLAQLLRLLAAQKQLTGTTIHDPRALQITVVCEGTSACVAETVAQSQTLVEQGWIDVVRYDDATKGRRFSDWRSVCAHGCLAADPMQTHDVDHWLDRLEQEVADDMTTLVMTARTEGKTGDHERWLDRSSRLREQED